MAASYRLEFTAGAAEDLEFLLPREQKVILARVREQLSFEPLKETRNRKQLRENPISSWELRVDKYRVFYDVQESLVTVAVVAVGWKEHNKLFIRGKEVEL
jgi:mRNA-degrading endonuclease RelE of RelBE toxin-antitoxin system